MLKKNKLSLKELEKIRHEYPAGCPVELINSTTRNAPPLHTKGTVEAVNYDGTVKVIWENGSNFITEAYNIKYVSPFPNRETLEKIKHKYPVGCKIMLLKMDDIAAPPIGTIGIVKGVDDAGNIQVHWENGSDLSVAYGADCVERLLD